MQKLTPKALDGVHALYGNDSSAEQRCEALISRFESRYGYAPQQLVSAPGRTEILGNHTDHNHGRVLAASVTLDTLAAVASNGTNTVHLYSEGFADPFCVSLDQLAPVKAEEGTTASLIRGVAAFLKEEGVPVAGFDAEVTSTVFRGSGLSSSAAFEVLLCAIFDALFGGWRLEAKHRAALSQKVENQYFGKPCGLMDQMGASVGGAVAIDFQDPASPVVRRADYDFSASGHALCIVDTASSHGDLTDDYADITREMGAVAAYFGQRFLRDVPEKDFRAALPALRQACGDRAVLRALHYYADDRRAVEEAEALENGDFPRFLALVNDSGLSSALHLQNTWSIADPRQQAIPVALAVGRELLGGTGAIRVHGGGFAGTIQAFVPNEKLAGFKAGMEALLGAGKCHVLHIRPQGGTTVIG